MIAVLKFLSTNSVISILWVFFFACLFIMVFSFLLFLLICNISDVIQYIQYMYFQILFYYRLLQDIEYISWFLFHLFGLWGSFRPCWVFVKVDGLSCPRLVGS